MSINNTCFREWNFTLSYGECFWENEAILISNSIVILQIPQTAGIWVSNIFVNSSSIRHWKEKKEERRNEGQPIHFNIKVTNMDHPILDILWLRWRDDIVTENFGSINFMSF